MSEQDDALFLRKRITEIDNHRHSVLQENHRLGLIIDEYRKQMAGQFGPVKDLRDWFAGQALAGSLAGEPGTHLMPTRLATDCYAFADAMIAARSTKENEDG